ncbi:hypothetical protein C1645_730702 [Glomus cerebriforme]|uniref:Phytocyanin domain-containing protein n=1 Tax=Glomus cerebriforme TaxID=658196 RepID=A0A397TN35_9GLOM|nr:hypothetical protein C1645_730702 [Glomus cerebriforme]
MIKMIKMIKLFLLFITFTAFLITFVIGETWLVQVGVGGNNVFVPANFDMNVGDTVTYQFVEGTHDVIQSDTYGTCVKSASPNAFSSAKEIGSASAPPTVSWDLSKAPVGQIYYYCDVEDHCPVDKMYAMINVLPAGTPPKNPGVKASQVASPSSSTSATTSPSTPGKKSISSSDKQVSAVVVGGAILSLIGYFLY